MQKMCFPFYKLDPFLSYGRHLGDKWQKLDMSQIFDDIKELLFVFLGNDGIVITQENVLLLRCVLNCFGVKCHFVCNLQVIQKEIHIDGTDIAKCLPLLNLGGEYGGIQCTNSSTLLLYVFFTVFIRSMLTCSWENM